MLIVAAKELALQKGFQLVEGPNRTVWRLIDKYLGLPVLNPATLKIDFSLDAAVAYLKDLPDRTIAGAATRW